jgi:hypothetical protein
MELWNVVIARESATGSEYEEDGSRWRGSGRRHPLFGTPKAHLKRRMTLLCLVPVASARGAGRPSASSTATPTPPPGTLTTTVMLLLLLLLLLMMMMMMMMR